MKTNDISRKINVKNRLLTKLNGKKIEINDIKRKINVKTRR